MHPHWLAPGVLLIALLLDLLFPHPPGLWHPVAWQGRFITILWEGRRSSCPRGLFIHGTFILVLGLLLTFGIVEFLQYLVFRMSWGWGLPVLGATALFLSASFTFRDLINAGRRVEDALLEEDLDVARYLVSRDLVGRGTAGLDESGVASAVVESLSENFVDSVVAPMFWYAFGGLHGAWAYRFVNTADAMLGYREGEFEWGGKSAARLDDVLNFLPARIAGWLVAAAAGLSGFDGRAAWRAMAAEARCCPSPNSGWTMAAAAGGLGVRLEKPGFYVMNSSGRSCGPEDIAGIRRILWRGLALWIGLVLVLSSVGVTLILPRG